MSGQLLRRRPEDPRPAHPRGAHLRPDPTRAAGPDCGSSTPARSARSWCSTPTTPASRCPSWPTSGSTRSPTSRGPAELAAVLRGRTTAAQAAADRPAPHRRHRQHLRRRDPAARRAAPRPPAGLLRRREVRAAARRDRRILAEAIGAGARRWATSSTSTSWEPAARTRTSTRSTAGRGEPCPTCGRGVVRRLIHNGRSTYFCPDCQRLPRRTLPARIADRTGARSQPRPGRGR